MKKLFLASALLLSPLAAFADSAPKLYGDVGLTFVSYELNFFGDLFKASPKALRLAGGAELGKHLDVEVMLGLGTESDTIKFQGITYSDVTLKLDSMYGFFLKPKFELGPNFEIFGRLGYVHAVATLDFTGDIPYTTTKSGVSYGAGVRMLIDPKVSFDIDYTSYLGKSDHKASGFTFGVGYTF